MMTFKNFNAKQLQETAGFERKVAKVAATMGIDTVLYTEIINVEASSIDVLIIDDKMYFHKVHLYSNQVVKKLNSDFQDLIAKLGLNSQEEISTQDVIKGFNLMDEIQSILSRSMEMLNIENSHNLDKMDNTTSFDFKISIEDFTYQEISKIVETLVRNYTPLTYNFKMINISKNSVEILDITTECKLFQYTIVFESCYSNFINRYLSAIVPYEKFTQMKRNLLKSDFTTALSECINKEWDISNFLSFLLKKYVYKIEDKGFGNEGLKNVYNFFMETAMDEASGKQLLRRHFVDVPTYEQKKQANNQM